MTTTAEDVMRARLARGEIEQSSFDAWMMVKAAVDTRPKPTREAVVQLATAVEPRRRPKTGLYRIVNGYLRFEIDGLVFATNEAYPLRKLANLVLGEPENDNIGTSDWKDHQTPGDLARTRGKVKLRRESFAPSEWLVEFEKHDMVYCGYGVSIDDAFSSLFTEIYSWRLDREYEQRKKETQR